MKCMQGAMLEFTGWIYIENCTMKCTIYFKVQLILDEAAAFCCFAFYILEVLLYYRLKMPNYLTLHRLTLFTSERWLYT